MTRKLAGLSALAAAFAVVAGGPARAGLVITPTFTSNFVNDFGANATAAENAWIAAAQVFETNFSDNIHINITVDAVAGTSVFGRSNEFLRSFSYATLRNALVADATTADDATAVGPGGSVSTTDPVSGTHTWWVTTSEAKALGLIADSTTNNDGTTTFGAGNNFTFSGPIAPGTYDFQGIAAHEISEVMGRLGLSGKSVTTSNGPVPNSYTAIDLFSYTGAGTRGLTPGAGENFSIDNGATLLKRYNNAAANGADTRDWAPGTNDAFNQFSNSGVVNPVSNVDLRELDVIGYDRITSPAAVPEPATLAPTLGGVALLGLVRAWRRRRMAP